MGNPHKLTAPLLVVLMADGAELTIQTANPDQILYEKTAMRHKWPRGDAQPVTWMTFIAWAGLRREGQIPREMSWEDFSDTQALDVSAPDTDDDEEGPGDPTPPGPDPG